MRVVVLYKDNRDYSRQVIDFLHDFQRQTGRELETMDPETPEGAALSKAYDLFEFPTILALSNEGVMQTMWKGLPLPTISEVSYYVQ